MPASGKPIGKRRTGQRDTILSVLVTAKGPLTAKEILSRAQRRRPRLGRATVYRTIQLLLVHKRIRSITLPDGSTRYEPTDRGHHCFFRCEQCGTVYVLEVCLVSLPAGSMLPDGCRVTGHELMLFGTCGHCMTDTP
ncbi:MAG: transcriptional repressor [Phycisphaerae bacterium]|jgi:Fe2+ or Zn2+ uptake regulation protein